MQTSEEIGSSSADRAAVELGSNTSPKFETAAPMRLQQVTDEVLESTTSACPVPFNAQLPLPLPMSRWQDYSSSTSFTTESGGGDYLPPRNDPPSNAHLSRLSISDALSPSGVHPNFHMTAARRSEASPYGDMTRQQIQYPERQSGDATLVLQRTMSMPSTLSNFPGLSLQPVYQPATPSNIFSLESPFSFMPTSSEQSPIESSPHRASVSLPSSSGGLEALLNPSRAASSSLTHSKHAVPYYQGTRNRAIQSSERITGFSDPYPRRASSPDTTRRLRSPSPAARDSRQGSRAYPFTFMPLSKTNTPYSALPSSNVDPKKARIEAEKGRREELRDKFASLRDALPMEGQKASKINILDRAISYIGELKAVVEQQESQLSALGLEFEENK